MNLTDEIVKLYESPPNVAENVTFGEHVYIGSRTTIAEGVSISHGSIIGKDVQIGPRTQILNGALIMDGAIICPNDVTSVSSNGRILESWTSVGPGVLLHDEVELAQYAIVPTQRTIAHIGNLGSKNRVVTIYGSDLGPRYSIGCQVGVDLGKIRDNVHDEENTTEASASTYKPYLDIFAEIGQVVQKAYNSEGALIQEIRDIRKEHNLDDFPDDYPLEGTVNLADLLSPIRPDETVEYVSFEDYFEADSEE